LMIALRSPMKYSVSVLALAIWLGLSAITSAAQALESLNLRVGDLSIGAHLYSHQTLTRAQILANGGSHSFHLGLAGLVSGSFEMLGSPTSKDIMAVESDVLLYRTGSDAWRDYGLAETQPMGTYGHISSIPPVGTDYFARTQEHVQQSLHVRVIDVVFRRGSYVCLVRATGADGRFTASQVSAIARIVDSRIKRAS
jgi:hypothetical protein